MDLPWGDERTKQFVTNIGLITSYGPFGHNVMACEWTHHISYSPGLIAVCIRPTDATHANIHETKEFGVNIASTEQAGMSSIAGNYTGREFDKIKALEELGFNFYKGAKIKTLMVKDAALNAECKLFKEITLGDHTMFVGEVVEASLTQGKEPLAYHQTKYGTVAFSIPKPSEEERNRIAQIVGKHKKNQ